MNVSPALLWVAVPIDILILWVVYRVGVSRGFGRAIDELAADYSRASDELAAEYRDRYRKLSGRIARLEEFAVTRVEEDP